MTPSETDLIHAYLNGTIGAEDFERLQELLRGSAAARRTLRDFSTVDTKLAEIAALDLATMRALKASPVSSSTRDSRWLQWRPLLAAAAGLLIGLFSATAVFGYMLPHSGKVAVLLNEGFESGPAPLVTGTPMQAGVWSGDYSEVVDEQQGVKPASGTKMLRILRADYAGKPRPEGSYVGDLYRLIDLRSYRQELADGNAVAQMSAAFNAAPFPKGEAYSCVVSLYALNTDMATNTAALQEVMTTNGSLAMARKRLSALDRDPLTWQRVESELRLPAETDFLLVHLCVVHATKSQKRVTFDGHYIDDVNVTLTRRAAQP